MSDQPDTDIETRDTNRTSSAKLARQVEGNDWKRQLSTKEGRRFVWRLLCDCGVFRSSFTGNSETFFNEGRRSVGLKMLGEIDAHAPEAYALMSAEARAKQ